MTREESLLTVAEVVNRWPSSHEWSADQMDRFAQGVEDMDYASTARGIRMMVRRMKFRPSVSELREFVESERKAAAEPVADTTPRLKPPQWVHVWSWLRWVREPKEERTLPQQDGWDFTDDTDRLTLTAYTEMEEEWVAAGSPHEVRLPGLPSVPA
jgi:hypothetical protein